MSFRSKCKISILAPVLTLVLLTPLFVKAEAYCGNGAVDAGEECDDRNFVNRDGCSAYCKIEDMESPTVVSVSIEDGSTGVHTLTPNLTVGFSEPIDPASVTSETVMVKNNGNALNAEVSLSEDGKTAILTFKQDLVALDEHAVIVENVKDVSGNAIPLTIVSVFTAGDAIDHTAPHPFAFPPGGAYTVTQSLSLKAYLGDYTGSDEFLDPDATIYYTFEGIPTEKSAKYERPISIERNRVIRFFAVDKAKNKSPIKTEMYRFACPEISNAVEITPYPACSVTKCQYGFSLKGNVCVANLGGADPNDYRLNAVTAPLLSSDSPVNIISKPALYITPEHKGVLPRPVLFKETKRGTVIRFEKNTSITTEDGEPFTGYILPPENLYTKDFPIHFGYTFKSIFRMAPAEGGTLLFSPLYSITIPYGDNYEPDEEVTVFTFNAETEQYSAYPADWVSVDMESKQVTIQADKTLTFFIAQSGKNYNRAVFKDTEGHWARNYVEALYREGVVKGRDKDIFAPDENLTRAEFVKVALGAAGIEVETETSKAPFADVPLYAWYAPYIAKAKALGLVGGYPDGNFKPDQVILRVEAVHILMKAFGFDTASVDTKDTSADAYRDVRKSEWYFPAVRFAIQNNLIKGRRTKEGYILPTFGPDRPITRGEMAELTVKAITFQEESK
ncbi:S-layer homology domain-containing protein [Candidatus Peregrinibacteria bacterium]|nr:S-layer homology domain-containing protein [Candidatus Peregrinibacteria bacterium]